jgi:hypothetical protein
MDSYGDSYNGYDDLEGRLLAKMKAGGTPDLVMQSLKNGFGAALADVPAILDRPTRKQLFCRVAQSLLQDAIDGLEEGLA